MTKPRKSAFTEPAYILEKDDRFYKIIVSDHVLFELTPDTETILTFVVIRRAIGTFSIIYITQTFQKGKCTSRTVQEKKGITAKSIEKELNKIQTDFFQGVFSQTNYKITWDTLDLSKMNNRKEKLEAIKAWGKLKVC